MVKALVVFNLQLEGELKIDLHREPFKVHLQNKQYISKRTKVKLRTPVTVIKKFKSVFPESFTQISHINQHCSFSQE